MPQSTNELNEQRSMQHTRRKEKAKKKNRKQKTENKSTNEATPFRWTKDNLLPWSRQISLFQARLSRNQASYAMGDRIFLELPILRSRYGPVEQPINISKANDLGLLNRGRRHWVVPVLVLAHSGSAKACLGVDSVAFRSILTC